jgi:hypothetical protein
MHDALLVVEHLLRHLMPGHAVTRGGDGGCELACELCRQRIESAPVAAMTVDDQDMLEAGAQDRLAEIAQQRVIGRDS